MGNTSDSKLGAKSTTEEACLGVDLSGQLAIVTGCSAGIGIATVKQLVKQGCTVVMANRNQEKSNKAKQQILTELGIIKEEEETKKDSKNKDDTTTALLKSEEETKDNSQKEDEKKEETKQEEAGTATTTVVNKDDVLIPLKLDLSSLQSVYNFVETFISLKLTDIKPLTLIVNNAGVMALEKWQSSTDGYEMQFATNVLGHFYLSLLLINYYKKNLRIINVSSSVHTMAPKNLQSLYDKCIVNKSGPPKKGYGAWTNYGISKVGNIFLSREIANRYGKNNIYSYSLHPGVIMTELQRNMPCYQQSVLGFWSTLGGTKTIPQGAATTIYCCCQDTSKLVNGEFYTDCKEGFHKALDKRFRKGSIGVEKLQSTQWELCELLVTQKGFNLSMSDDK